MNHNMPMSTLGIIFCVWFINFLSDYELVLKGVAGSGLDIRELWLSSASLNDGNDVQSFQAQYINSSYNFKSKKVEEWALLQIEEVKVTLYDFSGRELISLIFDGKESTKLNWFSQDRLLSSPYIDFGSADKSVVGYYFDIHGDVDLVG